MPDDVTGAIFKLECLTPLESLVRFIYVKRFLVTA